MDKSVVAVTLVSLFEAVEAAKVGLKWFEVVASRRLRLVHRGALLLVYACLLGEC